MPTSSIRRSTFGIFALFCAAACSSPPEPTVPRPVEPRAASAPLRTEPTVFEPPQVATSPAPFFRRKLQPQAGLTPLELAAFERVAPVFAAHCTSCHATGTRLSSAEAMRAVNMESYPFAGAPPREMGRKIRLSVGLGAQKRTMPPQGWHEVTGDDLALIAEWESSLHSAK